MYLRTFLIVSVISFAFGYDRKITSKLNPDCASCSENTTLVYIRADGDNNTVHHLWDFTRGAPTMITAVTGLNSSLTVSWFKDKPENFLFSEEPMYSFAMAIPEIYEYNDLNDLGHMDGRSAGRGIPLGGRRWARQDSVLTERRAMLLMQARARSRNGTVAVKLDFFPSSGFSPELPHLIHTSNSSLLDVQLVNMSATRGFNSSRFALRLLLVGTEDDRGTMVEDVVKSLDDEHTPGVFEIIELKTPVCARGGGGGGGGGGFLQFRPVAYTEPERGVTTSTVVHTSHFNRTHLEKSTTLFTFYRDHINVELLIRDVFVSFGEPGDGFYRQHNYTAWSTTFGYGAPPVETFSLLVILVICIGLSVPAVLAVSGAVYVAARRCRPHPHRRLDDH
ncbi:hypothetical protein MSG28_012128 [Choristoneura fumiferana]|uniref:Uncharacterized protein n=1 Tax=Choristoneura fumiferana TaxID=7141 RepID=A0ACC0KBX3_CHOFU|nr:hypothetical protein MSG28_012128 [Choristoneura fumiferana]